MDLLRIHIDSKIVCEAHYQSDYIIFILYNV